jgi:oligosaccharide repeat unit polymerase
LLSPSFRWYKSFGYFNVHVIMAIAFLIAISLARDIEMVIGFIACTLMLYIALVKRFDYLDPLVGYLVPWIIMLFFSTTRLSRYAIGIHAKTYGLVLLAVTGAMFAAGGPPHKISKIRHWANPVKSQFNPHIYFIFIDISFVSFTALNILIAGYVPLLRGLSGDDTGYLDFGIHGVYGFYLALANALAIVNFIIFLRTGKIIYIVRYVFILVLFVVLITRQNLISVAVESVVAYSVLRRRIKWRTIILGAALAGIIFSLMGSFRSGNIRDIAGVENEYSWVPEPVIWVYAYSYFNLANTDNLVIKSDAPYYDASSLSSLIPSFLRPKYDTGDYLLVRNFNVSSYMFPVYEDMGRAGVFLLTLTALRLTARKYQLLGQATSIGDVGTYSVLYFCASFSFFYNFWFFLPVIFQIVFFKMLNNVSERACVLTEKKTRVLGPKQLFANAGHAITPTGEPAPISENL